MPSPSLRFGIVAAALALLAGVWVALDGSPPPAAHEVNEALRSSAAAPNSKVEAATRAAAAVAAPAVAPQRRTDTGAVPPDLQLLGTAVTPQGALAIVRPPGSAQLLTVRVGDQVEGLVVAAIQPGRIALAAGTPTSRPVYIDAATGSVATQPPTLNAQPAAPLPPPTHYTEPEIVVEGH